MSDSSPTDPDDADPAPGDADPRATTARRRRPFAGAPISTPTLHDTDPDLASAGDRDPEPERGIETRRQMAQVAAALFDEPIIPIRIGRFTIIRELGAGGMGLVYVAYDEELDRRVAVKLLRGSKGDGEAAARLQREAQAMARLSHPNVVTVHEVGNYQGQIFVAMEFVDGQDLRRWLATADRPWPEVLALFRQAGEGLAAAHEAGLVHRDFKPDNVLVGKDGRARVADFGLAHALDAALPAPIVDEPALADSASRLGSTLTKTGAIMGTPAYMAPEQFRSARTDARTDQFSFCVALWEGLHGSRPFSGDNIQALTSAVTEGRIDASAFSADVPPWLRAIVARGLAPDPAERWPSMRDLLAALVADPSARRRRRLRAGAIACAVVVLIAASIWLSAQQIAAGARQRYWSGLTDQLLELERERGLRQAADDALRARDATRMSVYRSYRPKDGVVDHEDPTVAAALLREVEGGLRDSEAWISAANEILGRPISYAVLTDHRDTITALVFAPDGRTLYSGAADGEVRRWRFGDRHSQTIVTHGDQITALALSPDGRTLLSSAKDHTVRRWSLDRPEPSAVIAEHDGEVTTVVVDHQGRRAVSAGKDNLAKIIDLGGEAEPRALAGHRGAVYAAVFSADDRRVLTGSADGDLRLWRVRDGALLAVLSGHTAPVFHLHFVDDHRLLSAADDGTVRAWTLRDDGSGDGGQILHRQEAEITGFAAVGERFVATTATGQVHVGTLGGAVVALTPHGDGVWAAALLAGGEQVLTASFDTTARLTRADGRGHTTVFSGQSLPLLRLAVDAGGRWMATGSYDGSVRIWSVDQPPLTIPLVGHERTVFGADFSPSGDRVATASSDGTVGLWRTTDGALLARFAGDHGAINHVRFAADQRTIAAATSRGPIELWDSSDGNLRTLVGHDATVWRLAFSADGQTLASASFDGTARLWDLASGQPRALLEGHRDKVIAVDFAPDGRRIATASHDGSVRIWTTDTGENVATLRGHSGRVTALARSPDGRTLATTADDRSAIIWPDEDPEHAIVLRGHTKMVWSAAFDVTGTRLVTASRDGTARIWSTADGALIEILDGHAEALWDARFIPDGRIITISDDNTIRVWPANGNAHAITLSGHADAVMGMVISPDGVTLAATSADARASLWHLDRLIADRGRLERRLSQATMFCLTVEQRVRDLGEDQREAEQNYRSCVEAEPR